MSKNILWELSLMLVVCVLRGSFVSANTDGVLTCSWDQGLCGWQLQRGDRFKWNSETSAKSHGKTVFATPNSIDESFLWSAGGDSQLLNHNSLAILRSVEFYNPEAGALRFWHVANSIAAPGLYINVTQNGKTSTVKRYQTFAHHWIQRIVNVPGPGRTIITIAAAPVGHGIDEIEYSRDAEIAVFRDFVVPFERPPVQDGIVSCSFSKSLCGWSAFPGMAGQWRKADSALHLPTSFVKNSSNPWFDSWFVSVNRANDEEEFGLDAQAAIVTSQIRQTAASWLSFWWAKHELSGAESAIFVRVMTETGVEPVFHSKLPTSNWVNQNITISQTGLLRIIIGFQLSSFESYGALDEIQYSGDLINPIVISSTVEPEGSGDTELFLF